MSRKGSIEIDEKVGFPVCAVRAGVAIRGIYYVPTGRARARNFSTFLLRLLNETLVPSPKKLH